MEPGSRHVIHRQKVEVIFPSRESALDGQNEISELYNREIVPLIGEIFDKVAGPGRHIRMDRLEIDVGDISLSHFTEDLKNKIQKELTDKLLKELQETQQSAPANGVPTSGSENSSNLELFTVFVKTGQRPWWASGEQLRSIGELALGLLTNQPESMRKTLNDLLPNKKYRNRIIQQFSDEVLGKFIELKVPAQTLEKIKTLNKNLSIVHRTRQIIPLNDTNFSSLLWESAFNFWYLQNRNPNAMSSKVLKDYGLQLVRDLTSAQNDKQGRGSSEHQFIRILSQRINESKTQIKWFDKVLTELEKSSDQELKNALQDNDTHEKESTEQKQNLLIDEDSFEVHNAGLVLLAVFLPKFFDNLGLTKENKFITDEAAKRAALLLEYIVTFETEAPEYELLLNKLLCGLPADEPLPSSIEVSKTEKKEIEKLFDSVLEHWKALKNTSPEGLRQTFLLKDGLLNREDKGWKLTVERKTVDVLVDKIPWTISIIKLPWNDHLIYVEW